MTAAASTLFSGGDHSGAEGATPRGKGNDAEAFGAGPGGGGLGSRGLVETSVDGVHGDHDEQVDRRGDQQKGDYRVEEIPEKEFAAVDGEQQSRKIRFADQS